MRFLVPALAAGLLSFCVHPARSQTGTAPVSPAESVPAESAPAGPGLADAVAGSVGAHWRLIASPYTFHYSRDPLHRPVVMVGVERQQADKSLWGGTVFSNSFGQPCAYLYGGERLENWSEHPQLYAQWTAGVMYGYHGRFKDKVPLNVGGFSPGLVLAVGWQFTRAYSAQVNVLGNSALMVQLSVDLR